MSAYIMYNSAYMLRIVLHMIYSIINFAFQGKFIRIHFNTKGKLAGYDFIFANDCAHLN